MPFPFSKRVPTIDLAECSKKPAAERKRLATTLIEDLCASIRGLHVEADRGSREILKEVYNPPPSPAEARRPRKLVKKDSRSTSQQLPSPPLSPTSPTSFTPVSENVLTPPVTSISTPAPQIRSTILPYIVLCYRYFLTHLHNPFPADHIRELISQHSSTPRTTIDHWFAQTRLNTGWDTLLTVLSSPKLSPLQRDQYRERILVHTNNYFVNNQSSGSAQMDSIMAGIRAKAQALYYNDVVLGNASNNTEEAKKRYPTPAGSPEPEPRGIPEPAPQAKKPTKKRSRPEECVEDATVPPPPAKRLMRRKPLGRARVPIVDIVTSSTKRTWTEDDDDVPRTTKRARIQTDAVIPIASSIPTPEVPISPPSADMDSKKKRRLSDSHTSFVLPTINNNMAAKRLLRSVSTPALERSDTGATLPPTPPPAALSLVSSPYCSSPPSPQSDKSFEFPNDPRVFDGWFDRINSKLGDDATYAFARYV